MEPEDASISIQMRRRLFVKTALLGLIRDFYVLREYLSPIMSKR
ncbi:hypothetical protein [Nitrososphaera viennensis]|uniref:Uncharacterized protein n=2 Tax=Nitrososphaera viennensis TaxID=1034015 RepID=A0A060HH84_9ARCH|nr:hypothetical protein [Nitrososphaera viennensis]AIC15929.1 hypothetical protein NVIE_016750 [Nitrososphaera viennensis EN76]UVS67912.1 hypothetical protein NWT39_08345 [Nitrososphaera viennensis]